MGDQLPREDEEGDGQKGKAIDSRGHPKCYGGESGAHGNRHQHGGNGGDPDAHGCRNLIQLKSQKHEAGPSENHGCEGEEEDKKMCDDLGNPARGPFELGDDQVDPQMCTGSYPVRSAQKTDPDQEEASQLLCEGARGMEEESRGHPPGDIDHHRPQ